MNQVFAGLSEPLCNLLLVNLEGFLEGLRQGLSGDEGCFTLSAERAKKILAERSLTDVWTAWLCLAQGLLKVGGQSHRVTVNSTSVEWWLNIHSVPLPELLSDERALLGWLNLDWFGQPTWSGHQFTLRWRGNLWRRFMLARQLSSLLKNSLPYAQDKVLLNGEHLQPKNLSPEMQLCLYPCPVGLEGALRFPSSESLSPRNCRIFDLGWARDSAQVISSVNNLGWSDSTDFDSGFHNLAALAMQTQTSWSEVTWVHRDVVVKIERNTLERPGVAVTASIDALGLQTDLSGFSVVHNEGYFDFINRLKRDVLWMF